MPLPRPFSSIYSFSLFLHQGTLLSGLRWLLALVFIYSGAVKIIDPPRFAQIIDGFGLLPYPLLLPAAIVLPLLELIAGVGLLFNKRGSLTAIASMLVLFMAVLAYGIHLGLDIDCGCFGPEDPEQAYKGLKAAFTRDTIMMFIVIFLYWQRRTTTLCHTKKKTKGVPE